MAANDKQYVVYCRFFPGFTNLLPAAELRDLDDASLRGKVVAHLTAAVHEFRRAHTASVRCRLKSTQRDAVRGGQETPPGTSAHATLHPSLFRAGIGIEGPHLALASTPGDLRWEVQRAFAKLGLQEGALHSGGWLPRPPVFRLLRLLAWAGWIDRRHHSGGKSWHPWYDLTDAWDSLWSPRFALAAVENHASAMWISRSVQNCESSSPLNAIFGATQWNESTGGFVTLRPYDTLSIVPEDLMGIRESIAAYTGMCDHLHRYVKNYAARSGDESLASLARLRGRPQLIELLRSDAIEPAVNDARSMSELESRSPIRATDTPSSPRSSDISTTSDLTDGPLGHGMWRVSGDSIDLGLAKQEDKDARILFDRLGVPVPFTALLAPEDAPLADEMNAKSMETRLGRLRRKMNGKVPYKLKISLKQETATMVKLRPNEEPST